MQCLLWLSFIANTQVLVCKYCYSKKHTRFNMFDNVSKRFGYYDFSAFFLVGCAMFLMHRGYKCFKKYSEKPESEEESGDVPFPVITSCTAYYLEWVTLAIFKLCTCLNNSMIFLDRIVFFYFQGKSFWSQLNQSNSIERMQPYKRRLGIAFILLSWEITYITQKIEVYEKYPKEYLSSNFL